MGNPDIALSFAAWPGKVSSIKLGCGGMGYTGLKMGVQKVNQLRNPQVVYWSLISHEKFLEGQILPDVVRFYFHHKLHHLNGLKPKILHEEGF